jgi:ribosomal protein L37AE/L43A
MTTQSMPNSHDGQPIGQLGILRLRWKEFCTELETKKDYYEALYKMMNGELRPDCKFCGSQEVERDYGARFGACRDCGAKIYFTAGTFFHNIRHPQAWLGAIWLLEHGVQFNAWQFHLVAGIAYSTAWTILKKLAVVLQSHVEADPVCLEIASVLFAPTFCKRSLETPANEPPSAEQNEIEKRSLDDGGTDDVTNGSHASASTRASSTTEDRIGALPGPHAAIYAILSVSPIEFDELSRKSGTEARRLSTILTMLELDGLASSLPGNKFVRAVPVASNTHPLSTAVTASRQHGSAALWTDNQNKGGMSMDAIAVQIDFIRSCFQGISRKYLQLFLATSWCLLDRGRWPTGSLFRACIAFSKISYEEIRLFVSPLYVKLAPI